jgi:type IX secretion system PorP/SprF family membrane protein
MNIKLSFILLFSLGLLATSYAQQMPVFSQYKKNRFFFNPALAGAYGYTEVGIAARNQWLGFKNPPRTMVVSGQGRILKQALDIRNNLFGEKQIVKREKGNVGFGGAVFADKNSHINKTGIKGCYSYHLKLPKYSQVSFGLSLSGYQINIDREKLNTEQANDPMLHKIKPSYSTDISAGVFYLHQEKFYAGVSFQHILQSIDLVLTPVDNTALRHYYFMGGYTFTINKDLHLETSSLLQFNEKSIPLVQSDLSARLKYQDKWWAGLSWRSTNDLVIMGGLKYKDYIIGYSYDYGIGKIITHTYGTHEISILYRFGSHKRKFKWKDRY